MRDFINKQNDDQTCHKSIGAGDEPRKISGFSLLEIMVVLSIIAISSGLLVWRINQSNVSLDFEEITSALQKTIHSLRQHSRSSGNTASLEIDRQNGGWRINGEAKNHFQSNAEISAFSFPKSSGRHLQKIVFFSDGSSNGAFIQIKRGSQYTTIYLDPLTSNIFRRD